MIGVISRILGRKFGKNVPTGVGPSAWQPPRIVQPTYELREKDRPLWEAFERAASANVTFETLITYAPAAGEPTAERLKGLDDDVWWSRSTGQLLILVERLWAGFPDPLAFSLLSWDARQERLIDLGQFWTLPDRWTKP